jgi:hypothetical protein
MPRLRARLRVRLERLLGLWWLRRRLLCVLGRLSLVLTQSR